MKASLADRIHDTIRAEIITCVLAPGQQIAQPQLAEKYKVGMTPVREALQRLAQEGFVQPIPRFGYIVSPITLSDVSEIFELRSVLESAAVRLAATRGSDEQLQNIASNSDFTYTYRDRASYLDYLSRNVDFHRSIAEASGNRRLADAISKIHDQLTRVINLSLDLPDKADELHDAHLALAKALCDRNPDLAEQLVQEEIAFSQQRVLQVLLQSMGAGKATGLSPTIRARQTPGH